MSDTEQFFVELYDSLLTHGQKVSPRGQPTIECVGISFSIPPYVRFCSFKERKLNLNYIREEFKWYIKGDLNDLSIAEHASIWKDCITNEKLYSNYGYAIFRRMHGSLQWVVETLATDRDSRRAVIPINQPHHLFNDCKDVPCTMYLNFMIRDNALMLSVHMRSQDAVFGLGNDLPFFSLVQEMACHLLSQELGEELNMGALAFHVDSFHAYSRHWDLLRTIASGEADFEEIEIPPLSGAREIGALLMQDALLMEDDDFEFTKWLYQTQH